MQIASILKKNKAVIKFLLLFFGTYIIFSLAYQGYIKYVKLDGYHPDYITHKVAEQSYYLIDWLGYETYINKHPKYDAMLIWIREKAVFRVIEGCNAVSVIILFLSFIVAFKKRFLNTFLYILLGSFIIYMLNLIRLVLIGLGLYFYPEYRDLMHDILFPLFIYGVVLLLWLFWIKNYNKKAKK